MQPQKRLLSQIQKISVDHPISRNGRITTRVAAPQSPQEGYHGHLGTLTRRLTEFQQLQAPHTALIATEQRERFGGFARFSRPRSTTVFPQKRLPLGAHGLSSGREKSQVRPPSTRRGP